MNEFIKFAVLVCLVAIVVSLGSGMFHMMNDKGDSKRMVKALTVRIGLSVALFLLLMLAWKMGYIHPHGLNK